MGGDLKLPENREALRSSLSLGALHFMRQTHSNKVLVVSEEGSDFECDALVTTSRNVGLAALAADCMPVTFSAEKVIGVAHIGRVGLVKGIAEKVIEAMRELGAGKIKALIGPSICAQCYEVSYEMYEEVTRQIPATATSPQRRSLDLQGGLSAELKELGVEVHDLAICTRENSSYFSYRAGDAIARHAGVISQ
jgi:YfiH family protein